MIEIELDGKKVSVAEGSMVMHAADKAGTYIPHFCYHKKLSIAANCRMCLVDVEKAPKPMPACATPVTQGMIVRTRSDKAINAQQGVMEFLLINHPLDCPICDQGGECQLQDLAVGYGASSSRYSEEKRVIFPKNFGPLIAAREMNRCIQCTRCVRFGAEVAGVMELGMVNRGEHSEITTIAGDTVDSEVSGNMIDLCPVGALTSKPFRFSARAWELSRRKSVSPHDSTGTNLIVQVKGATVMRVLPLENEDVNECWLADRDRFSYEALNTSDRLTTPMIKQNGVWQAVDWTTALEYVARSLTQISAEHGPASIGALASPMSTVEELHLLAKLVRGLGSENIDVRLRHADFTRADGDAGKPGEIAGSAIGGMGTTVASLSALDRALIVGSFLRKDHPLFSLRIRAATKKGGQVHSVHALADDWLMPMGASVIAPPSGWVDALGAIAAALGEAQGVEAPSRASITDEARAIAESLASGERKAVLLGNAAAQHPQASELLRLATWIGARTGASVGYFGEAANMVGAHLVNALPGRGGLNAGQMLGASGQPRLKACLLLNTEPTFDSANPAAAGAALRAAELVVAMTPFKPADDDLADVVLPTSPFAETSGTFVSSEGRVQSFHGVVKPLGDTRPAWKVLRVLGNLLDLEGFGFESADEVRAEAIGEVVDLPERHESQPKAMSTDLPRESSGGDRPIDSRMAGGQAAGGQGNGQGGAGQSYSGMQTGSLERISDVPIYQSDLIVRRATSLQLTADARAAAVSIPRELAEQLRIDTSGSPAQLHWVRVTQGGASAVVAARVDASLPAQVVRIAAAHPDTVGLGAMFGNVMVEAAPAPADDPRTATLDLQPQMGKAIPEPGAVAGGSPRS
ncbi:NADH-quinone oxidoreductase subunit NuoG [Piscinibacter koreensis]|uniref:NADH-quinone oxidoreductase n=1 Tax=Piscinibacter koreensis TaxID=2742824 RepID=A0A7Y6TYI8_9BURK|nr:NADH-quinone oxidoreductase subunit NuoG [Schlegelella koreensis]NUZ08136.1 NADH-quinone oxidoreductase subunit G [Schlegelella koreensis]